MSYTITQDCIRCSRCLSACPTQAIESDGSHFWIEASRCNQCAGSHGVPQCWSVCPTNEGCVPLISARETASLFHPTVSSAAPKPAISAQDTDDSSDYWESWFATYNQLLARLRGAKQSEYWQSWFDIYAQNLRSLQPTP